MGEKEELEWLREQHIRNEKRELAMSRGMGLGILAAFIFGIDRRIYLPLVLILFLTGVVSAYYGKFKYKYVI